jgi:flavin-dependent dehydrogenase
MAHTFHSDIIIVGAGPVGSYLGWKLASSGCRVLVLEKRPLASLGGHIEIVHLDQIRCDELGIPHPEVPELLHLVSASKTWSVDGREFFEVRYPVYVVNLPAYLQRLHGYLREAGGELVELASVERVLIENGAVKGVAGSLQGKPFEARAQICVDASGMAAALRTRLPEDFAIENTPVPPEQTFFCALELRLDLPPGMPTGNNTFLGAPGFWNRSYDDGAVLGIITPGSAEAAWQAHRQWRESTYGDPGRLVARRLGSAPYRRPPATLVADGFAAVGDCVYQNKAFSGEGITSGCAAAQIASEILAAALKRGDTTARGLWEYNQRYFRGQGAKFASLMSFYFPVTSLPRQDVDALYKNHFIFSAHDQEYLNNHYELDLPSARWESVCSRLETAVRQGGFSAQSLQTMKNLYFFSTRLKNHYLAYPDDPSGLPEWKRVTGTLWGH